MISVTVEMTPVRLVLHVPDGKVMISSEREIPYSCRL